MHPHYSLAKISQELGDSKTTVSLTLSGKARQVGISEEQEKRILKFCRKVDYRPNIHAQRLNSRLAKNIGILLERVEDGATAQLLGGLVDDADQAGFRTTIKVFRPDQSESIIFDWLLTHEVDGVIYYGLELPAASLERIISENWPVIGIGVSPRLGIPVVNANNFTAGHTITENLIRHGFREFHFFLVNRSGFPGEERERGMRTAMAEAGLQFPEDRVYRTTYGGTHAAEITQKLLDTGKLRPGSALVCVSDYLAVCASKMLLRNGFRIPDDFAVAGINGSATAADFTPPITSFEYLPADQGRTSVRLLLEWLKKKQPPASLELQGKTVPAQSTPA